MPVGPALLVLQTFLQYLPAFSSRPEAASDVTSGAAVEKGGTDGPAKLGDSGLNIGRITRLFGRTHQFHALFAVFSFILQPTGSN